MITPIFDRARGMAAAADVKGPFGGVPFLVKDLMFEVAGVPFHEGMRYLSRAWCNITGQPSISLPLAISSEGLPIGIQLVAPQGREDRLLTVAAQLERAIPWDSRHPAI